MTMSAHLLNTVIRLLPLDQPIGTLSQPRKEAPRPVLQLRPPASSSASAARIATKRTAEAQVGPRPRLPVTYWPLSSSWLTCRYRTVA